MMMPQDEAGWISLAVGILLLLFGSFLVRGALSVVGAVLGAALGLGAGHGIAQVVEADTFVALGLHIGGIVLGGIVGVLLFRFVETVAFFLIGAGLAVWVLLGISPNLEQWGVTEPDFVMAVGIPILAVVMGILMVVLKTLVLGAATAAIGSLLIMNAFGWPWMGLPAIGLFALGLVVQWKLFGKRPARRDGNGEST